MLRRCWTTLAMTMVLIAGVLGSVLVQGEVAAQGRLVEDQITSPSLEGNLLGDPATRNMTIYLPPSYDEGGRFPVVYLLHGYLGDERIFIDKDHPYWLVEPDFPENGFSGMLDDLIAAGELKEVIVVTTDGSNKYGGSFYTNSELTGNYEDYIVEDLVSYIDAHYRTIISRDSRVIVGHSMGGYGAMTLAMKHPDVFGAVAVHGAPLYFEGIKPMIPMVVAENPDGMIGPHPERLLTSIGYAMSAAFSPNLENPPFFVDLPFEYPTGAVIDEVWDRWLEHDPFTMLDTYGGNLASLRGVYFDCGDQDMFGVAPHAEAFHQALTAAGIEHEYQPFAGGHYERFFERLTISLSFVSNALVSEEEANKAAARRGIEEIWNQGNLAVVDDIVAAGYVYHEPAIGDIMGPEGLKQAVSLYRAAYPDLHFTVEDMIAEGDMVVTRWTGSGTHQGELMGIPATGLRTTATGINITRYEDGKAVEEWSSWDVLGLMQQFGVMPAMGREDFTWGEPSEVTGAPGDPEANKALVMRYVEEGWNQQNLDVLDEIMSPEAVNHEVTLGRLVGIEAHKQGMSAYLTAFPDLHTTAEDWIAEGDLVVERWTATGTQQGELVGIPASGNRARWTGITVYRIADGKMVELWWAWDALGLMQQLTAPTAEELVAQHEAFQEALNAHDMDQALSYCTDDLTWDYVPLPPSMDKEGTKTYFEGVAFSGFPDFHVTPGHVLVSGNILVEEHPWMGTQLGEWMGIPATGNSVQSPHIDIWEYEGEKVKRATTYLDAASVMIQLGAMPAPELPELVPSFELPDPEPTGLSPLEAAAELDARWNAHDLSGYAKLIQPDAEIMLGPLGGPIDRDAYIALQELYFAGFSDLHEEVVRSVDMGDGWVMFEAVITGTHDGPYFGIRATGLPVTVRLGALQRFDADGLMTNMSAYWDNLTILAQLGAVPMPGPPPTVSLGASRYTNIGPSETMEAIVSLGNVVHATNFVIRMQFDPAVLTPVLPTPDAVTVNTEVLPDVIPGWKVLASVSGDTVEIAGAALGATTASIGEPTWVVKLPFLTAETFSSDQQTGLSVVDAQMGYPGGRTTPLDVTGVEVTLNRTAELAGDMDGDRDVDVDDFLLFASSFGTSCGDVDYDPLADLDGNCTVGVDDFLLFAGQFGGSLSKLAALARDRLGLPLTPVLYPNTPNPFNPSTTLVYELPQASNVTLTVYTVTGQQVIMLVSGHQDAGRYEVTWDGKDGTGCDVASGVYVARLVVGGQWVQTRRMALMR